MAKKKGSKGKASKSKKPSKKVAKKGKSKKPAKKATKKSSKATKTKKKTFKKKAPKKAANLRPWTFILTGNKSNLIFSGALWAAKAAEACQMLLANLVYGKKNTSLIDEDTMKRVKGVSPACEYTVEGKLGKKEKKGVVTVTTMPGVAQRGDLEDTEKGKTYLVYIYSDTHSMEAPILIRGATPADVVPHVLKNQHLKGVKGAKARKKTEGKGADKKTFWEYKIGGKSWKKLLKAVGVKGKVKGNPVMRIQELEFLNGPGSDDDVTPEGFSYEYYHFTKAVKSIKEKATAKKKKASEAKKKKAADAKKAKAKKGSKKKKKTGKKGKKADKGGKKLKKPAKAGKKSKGKKKKKK